jgi:Galactose oxidase, central domain
MPMKSLALTSVVFATALAAPVGAVGRSGTGPCYQPGRLLAVNGPAARSSVGLADDPSHGQIVLFGGWDGVERLGDTWTWDGTTWTERHPATSPLPRSGQGMTYDAARDEVVLVGGWDGENDFADTWTWDGSTWIEQHPAHLPNDGRNQLAFDAGTREVVMNSDQGDDAFTSWTWDGADWRDVRRSNFTGRDEAAVSRDGNHVMLFGGLKELYEELFVTRSTYIWDGTTWRLRKPPNKPDKRESAALAYDAARDRVVLFGGTRGNEIAIADTWTWDGSDWTRQRPAASPVPRHSMSMVYDSTRQEIVLFGGASGDSTCRFGDTWMWDGVTWTEL